MIAIAQIVGVTVLMALFVLYNGKVIKWGTKKGIQLEGVLGRTLGVRLRKLDSYLEKQTIIANNRGFSSVSKYYDEIIVNLDLKKERVTVSTFVAFLLIISLGTTLVVFIFTLQVLLSIVMFFLSFYMYTTIFNFISLMRYERREGLIMDVEDLLAMGAGGGIKNAITRYTPSIHPQIRPYFDDFLTNMNYHGYSFKEAMNILNNNLGGGFSSFARLAIQYEEKAEDGMEEIFAPSVDMNRRKRDVRQTVNKRFTELRTAFFMSTIAVFGFVGFMLLTDYRAQELVLDTPLGNISLIHDVATITLVLAYITAVKAKFMK